MVTNVAPSGHVHDVMATAPRSTHLKIWMTVTGGIWLASMVLNMGSRGARWRRRCRARGRGRGNTLLDTFGSLPAKGHVGATRGGQFGERRFAGVAASASAGRFGVAIGGSSAHNVLVEFKVLGSASGWPVRIWSLRRARQLLGEGADRGPRLVEARAVVGVHVVPVDQAVLCTKTPLSAVAKAMLERRPTLVPIALKKASRSALYASPLRSLHRHSDRPHPRFARPPPTIQTIILTARRGLRGSFRVPPRSGVAFG